MTRPERPPQPSYPATFRKRRGFLRRHRYPLVTGTVIVLLLAGGLSYVLTRPTPKPVAYQEVVVPTPSDSAPVVPPSTVPPTVAVRAPATTGTAANEQTTGVLLAKADALTWTIRTDAGTQFTVHLVAKTAFGPKKKPSTADAITVNKKVLVTGPIKGDQINAVRITAVS